MKRLVVMRMCKRHLHQVRHHWFRYLAPPWIAVLLLAFFGIREYLHAAKLMHPEELQTIWSWSLEIAYRIGQLFVYESMGDFDAVPVNGFLSWARLLAPFVLALTAVVGLLSYFSERFHLLLIRWTKGHVVMVGWGADARDAALAFRAAGEEVLLLHPAPESDLERFCKEEEILLLQDGFKSNHPPYNRSLVRRINARNAKVVLCIDSLDGQNLDSALRIAATGRARKGSILCHVQDLTLVAGIRSTGDLEGKGVRLVNLDLARARDLTRKLDPMRGFLSSRDTWKPSHLVILGFGHLGRAIALEATAASQWSDRPDQRPRVTVIDKDAADREQRFRAQHPEIHNALDIAFKQADIQSTTALDILHDVANDKSMHPVFAVTIDNAADAVSFALWLAQTRWTQSPRILVRMTQEDRDAGQIIREGLRELRELENKAAANPSKTANELKDRFRHYDHMTAFGRLDALRAYLCGCAGTIDEHAASFHEAYVAQVRIIEGKKFDPNHLNNQPWKDLHPCFRHSSREAAAHMPHKLSALGLDWDSSNPHDAAKLVDTHMEPLAKLEHLRWNAERWSDGWSHGTPKDIFAKRHPDLVPWDDLSEFTKTYDTISIQTLRAILESRPSQGV